MKQISHVSLGFLIVFLSSIAFAQGDMFKPSDEIRALQAEASSLALIRHLQLADDQRVAIKQILDNWMSSPDIIMGYSIEILQFTSMDQ